MKNLPIKTIIIIVIVSILLVSCALSPQEPPDITEASEPEGLLNFTIKADPELHAPISTLYSAFFPQEEPVYVDVDADLIATVSTGDFSEHLNIPATFLPNSVLIPQSNNSDMLDFIAFSISPRGQQVLIDAGELPSTIILTDQAGNQVEIDQPVYSVISSYGPSTAFIYSVGAMDRLVSASYLGARDPMGAAAMENIDPRFPEIMGDDNFSQQDFNIEEAAMLNPDLVITSARTAWLDAVDQLAIPVFLYDAENPDKLKEAMLLTGQLFGPHTTAQAQAWVAYYDGIIDTIQEQISELPPEERTRVLFTGTNPLRVASGEMYQTYIIDAAGGFSVSSELGGYWNDINLEQVVIWEPEVVTVPPYGGASVEAITESPEWQILEAVQRGQVYRMPKLVVPWDTPAPDSVLGIVWMAQLLNPERVDLDCAEEAEYFYNTFYNYNITAEEIASICSFD
jgi:iron complex transport system substrate-binding protein